MLNIALVEDQVLSKIGIQVLTNQVAQQEVNWICIDSIQELKYFFKKYKNGIVFLNPFFFKNNDNSIDLLSDLQRDFSKSKWALWTDVIHEGWLKKIMYEDQNRISIFLKSDPQLTLVNGIKKVINGEIFIADGINEMLKNYSQNVNEIIRVLTNAEREILREIAIGKMTKEIAVDRNVSIHTIITHRKNIFKKLKVNNAHDASRYAISAGLIDVNDYFI